MKGRIMQSEKTSLVCGIVGLCFVVVSLFSFGFLSIPRTILLFLIMYQKKKADMVALED